MEETTTRETSPVTEAAPAAGGERIASYAEFWPYYLREHSNPICRGLHYIGSSLAIACIVGLILTRNPWFFLAGLVGAYGFAWVGHFVFEKNRPATFQYPLWSFVSDWRMVALAATFQLKPELERARG